MQKEFSEYSHTHAEGRSRNKVKEKSPQTGVKATTVNSVI